MLGRKMADQCLRVPVNDFSVESSFGLIYAPFSFSSPTLIEKAKQCAHVILLTRTSPMGMIKERVEGLKLLEVTRPHPDTLTHPTLPSCPRSRFVHCLAHECVDVSDNNTPECLSVPTLAWTTQEGGGGEGTGERLRI